MNVKLVELGADVQVTEDGSVTIAPGSQVEEIEQTFSVAVAPVVQSVELAPTVQLIEIAAPGPQGPPGPPGFSYVHTQSVPDTTWTIDHNLGGFPNVSVVDSAGTNVEGDVVYVSSNRIVLTFTAPFSGNAYLS